MTEMLLLCMYASLSICKRLFKFFFFSHTQQKTKTKCVKDKIIKLLHIKLSDKNFYFLLSPKILFSFFTPLYKTQTCYKLLLEHN